MTKATIVRVLRAVADALDAAPSPHRPAHRVRIEDAPPGTPVPEPFRSHDAVVSEMLARIYLTRALRRYSPREDYYA